MRSTYVQVYDIIAVEQLVSEWLLIFDISGQLGQGRLSYYALFSALGRLRYLLGLR